VTKSPERGPMQGIAARCWRAGQRFERCVCQAPCRIQVAAIKRDQGARGFLDRVCLIRQRLTAGIRKQRCQSANRAELTVQHRASAGNRSWSHIALRHTKTFLLLGALHRGQTFGVKRLCAEPPHSAVRKSESPVWICMETESEE
jgi:hypothetical protein